MSTSHEAVQPGGGATLSQPREDYLAAIYRAAQGGERATTSEVARTLGVSAASTTHMFKKLAGEGLVEYKEYAGAVLTSEGKRAANELIRRHRLTERFLVDILGIPWDQVDEIADQMEHALPPIVIDRFEAVLENTETCPHGYPIPTREGAVAKPELVYLDQTEVPGHGVVARVSEVDSELLRYLGEQDLVPGQRVQVLSRSRFDDLWTLAVGPEGRQVTVGRRVAAAVALRDWQTDDPETSGAEGAGAVPAGAAAGRAVPGQGEAEIG